MLDFPQLPKNQKKGIHKDMNLKNKMFSLPELQFHMSEMLMRLVLESVSREYVNFSEIFSV